MFDLVFTDISKRKKLSDFRGVWLFLAGKCPRCGRHVACAVAEVEDPDKFPDVYLPHLECCRRFPPVEVAIVADGQVRVLDPLGKIMNLDLGVCATSPRMWNQVVLWNACDKILPGKQKLPAFPELSGPAGMWLKEISAIIINKEKFVQKGLLFSEKEAEKINKQRLYDELWKLPFAIYRWSENLPDFQTDAAFALYRALYRAVSGDGRLLVGMDGEKPLFAEFSVPEGAVKSDGRTGVLDHVWPFDMFAFSFGFLKEPEVMKNFLAVFVLGTVTDSELLDATLEKIRTGRCYTLTPGGVRAVLPKDEITGVRELVMEERDSTVFAVAKVSEQIFFPVWFDWREGFGFSPWQVQNGFAPGKDPFIHLLAKTFCELVTARSKEIRNRVYSGECGKAVLLPGEGEVRIKRTVYIGRSGGGGTGIVRRKLPTARKAPAPHAVAGHLRRVRKSASPEAVERAKNYGIEVPEGFTFVRPFNKGEGGEFNR
ncbi:hypothetical protein Desku_0887 [Desulfofundulus kuznetsovii DSM 6115]|uniref:Uncharacterized protein n=1 Tax=Desulfofundulus kuznetsovii (strain DSM 6115 / VKM B-1805 / 17) TaxID=760568 RepID=A0AAU8PS20_DESK7|nr:hypothetical protein Desku_0887 [Desulfofundulus kuznetsovii DSM 6115]